MKPTEPLEGLRSPPAPPHLKGRVLQVARRARTEHRNTSLEYRLWNSWGLRLGWLGAVAALLVTNLAIPVDTGSRLDRAPGMAAQALVSGDVDALPVPPRSVGNDRAAVLCELEIDCTGVEKSPSTKGDRT